ncbi:hypothetical protein [uncultured Thiodictyon sp.]|uniref:hypothetical protein n=1 Tax=uncultured Thiodictyon sp. TaxID=1846217 RepID=UPI0025F35597|nr:hypothetical protein [uncultured Thiodictyon sp.]
MTARLNPLATGQFWRRAGPLLLVLAVLGLYLGTRFRLAIDCGLDDGRHPRQL